MQIIRKSANANGAYMPMQSWRGPLPAGYAAVPDTLDTAVFYEYMGFVTLTLNGDTVTGMQGNQAALDAYKTSLPEPVEPPPTTEERVAALEAENKLLKEQVSAQADQAEFYEDCIAEMATVVYA